MNIKIKYLAIIMAFLNGQVFSAEEHNDRIDIGGFVARNIVKCMIVYQCTKVVTDPCATETDIDSSASIMNAVVPWAKPITTSFADHTKATQNQLKTVMPILGILANYTSTTLNHITDMYLGINYDPSTRALSITCKRPVFRFIGEQQEIIQTAGFQSYPYRPSIEVYVRYGSLVHLFAQMNDINLANIRRLNVDLSSLEPIDNIPAHIEGILKIGMEEVRLTAYYLVFSNTAKIAHEYLDENYYQLADINPDLQQLTLQVNDRILFSHDYDSCTQAFFDYCMQTRLVKWVRSLCGSREHQE